MITSSDLTPRQLTSWRGGLLLYEKTRRYRRANCSRAAGLGGGLDSARRVLVTQRRVRVAAP